MRCMNCGANIPPEYVSAIALNKCPGCNDSIMNEQTQELLKELASAMERMPHDPQGVAGWLMSNYRFQKMGEAEPVEKFHRKGGSGSSEYDENSLKITPSYNEFVSRNDAGHLVSKSNELAAKFHGSKNGKIAELASMIQGVSDPYEDITVDGQVPEEDQIAMNEFKQAGLDPFASAVSAPLGAINDLSQAIDPREVMKLLKSQGDDVPLADELEIAKTEKGRALLQQRQFKKIKAQDALYGGGGGPNSFRRA